MIYTGGTIGMVRNAATGALESCDFENLAANIPEMKLCGADIRTVTFEHPIDSSDMTPRHWADIVRIIAGNYDSYDGFVILHGTDTMAFTASALSFMLGNLSKPVILTGSQLPIEAIRTDAKENLLTAIEIASACDGSGRAIVPEVCIFFHEELIRGNRSSKVSANNLAAFSSSNYPILAHSGTEIEYHREYIRTPDLSKPLKAHYDMDPSIIIFSLFPGIRREAVEGILSKDSVKGVIFRTFGSGNAPESEWLVELLSDAVQNGKTIVNITQCATGKVQMEKYRTGRQLLDAGVVSGHDSTVEAALTKLMYLMGQGLSREEIRRQMNISLAGEITV